MCAFPSAGSTCPIMSIMQAGGAAARLNPLGQKKTSVSMCQTRTEE